MSIAVIDNASDTPAIQCYNKLMEFTGRKFTYHIPAFQGIESLRRLQERPEALFLFGSYSNVKDRLNWQKQVADYTKNALETGIPVLGICFGHQIMADAFGGEVGRVQSEVARRGARQFKTEDNAFTFVMDHSYEITRLPQDFVTMGSSPECRHDFVAHAKLPYWGVQGHPEASWDFVEATQEGRMGREQYETARRDGERFIHDFLKKFLS